MSGVREIMKNCIEKAAMLPVGLNSGVTQQCESLKKVLSYIFDRNAALLPGYFIVNEILKSYPENKTWPHWSLVSLVSNFLNSFRPAAAMVSCTNKWRWEILSSRLIALGSKPIGLSTVVFAVLPRIKLIIVSCEDLSWALLLVPTTTYHPNFKKLIPPASALWFLLIGGKQDFRFVKFAHYSCLRASAWWRYMFIV